MPLAIGKYSKRLTLLAPPPPESNAKDSFGKPVITYPENGKIWGEVMALGGREYWQAQADAGPLHASRACPL